jgi:hypothetical protein
MYATPCELCYAADGAAAVVCHSCTVPLTSLLLDCCVQLPECHLVAAAPPAPVQWYSHTFSAAEIRGFMSANSSNLSCAAAQHSSGCSTVLVGIQQQQHCNSRSCLFLI